jgi:murein DD-endopeptidase MepM/ murein hydrolase activator NlpD
LKTGFASVQHELLTLARQTVKNHPKRLTTLIAALMLGGGGGAFAVATLVPDVSDLPVRQVVELVQSAPLYATPDVLDIQPLTLFRSDITRATDTADTLLKRLGVDDSAAAAFVRSDATARQVLFGRSGRNVTAEASGDNRLIKLSARWSATEGDTFQRLVIEATPQGFTSRLETAALNVSTQLASGTIQSSLFAATDEARLPDSIAMQLAEIFSGDIDFHRALRKGDRFSVVYETLEGDGEPLRTGRVLSAEFVNNAKVFQAMWYQDAMAGNAMAKGGYYSLDGDSRRRAYLASPMEFSRVTSGFKMRMHPILRTLRAHNGVDYGAPTGTAVRSVGDGTVEFAGVQNGYGNVVILKHRNNHSTLYAHLSRINVRKGESISQGQNIGAVGATGWATGPHLHFEFRVNGVYQDPMTIARENESTPLSASAKGAFARLAAENKLALAAAASVRQSSTQ